MCHINTFRKYKKKRTKPIRDTAKLREHLPQNKKPREYRNHLGIEQDGPNKTNRYLLLLYTPHTGSKKFYQNKLICQENSSLFLEVVMEIYDFLKNVALLLVNFYIYVWHLHEVCYNATKYIREEQANAKI